MKLLKDADVSEKKVLLRVDFNVPLKNGEDGKKQVSDDGRIKAVIPTIKYLLSHRAKVIIMSHLGRPEGKVMGEYSLDPTTLRLQELLGKIVTRCYSAIGRDVCEAVDAMKPGEILMLGNIRYYPGEEANDISFAKELAKLGEIYVNDAFAVSHRAHASVEAITHLLPSYAGLLLEKEVKELGKVIDDPKGPFVCIMGGSKVADKIGVIKGLQNKIDCILTGGVMGNTFLAAKYGEIFGKTLIEKDKITEAMKLIKELEGDGKQVEIPSDAVVSTSIDGKGEVMTVKVKDEFDAKWNILDIGQDTINKYKKKLLEAKTIFWNGNVGMSEVKPFDKGSEELAKIMAEATDGGAVTMICGGDTTGLVNQMGLADRMTYMSTGGGAALEFLAGVELPGIKALE